MYRSWARRYCSNWSGLCGRGGLFATRALCMALSKALENPITRLGKSLLNIFKICLLFRILIRLMLNRKVKKIE